jgi:hypothetical protein
MKKLLIAAGLAALLVTPSFASSSTDTMKACGAAWKAMAPADQGKTTYKAYSTACLKNHGPMVVAAPVTPQQRMKDCAAKWNEMKKAGTTSGQTYQQFSKTCLKAS